MKPRSARFRLVTLFALALLLSLAGCASVQKPATTPSPQMASPEPAEEQTETLALNVYLTRGEKLGVGLRHVPKTVAVARAALEELLTGPSEKESEAGLSTAIPPRTRLLDVDLQDGVATVDLSRQFTSDERLGSMPLRVAQVVYTLTQFETVKRVAFMLDGKRVTALGDQELPVWPPLGRLDLAAEAAPAILVEAPAPWQNVQSPLRVAGMSNTFEGTLLYELVDASGSIVTHGYTTSSGGMGTWGRFDLSIEYTLASSGEGHLTVFEQSAKDGSRIHQIEIPLVLEE